MAELEALLFRKSRGELFDLPAYHEVLFLYSLARDLLDREAGRTPATSTCCCRWRRRRIRQHAPAPFADMPTWAWTHDRGLDRRADGRADDRPTAPVDFDLSSDESTA